MDWVDSPDVRVECLNEEPSPNWSEWSDWSDCSKKCKEDGSAGERERTRKCTFAVDSTHCDGDDVQFEKCNDIECTWTQWSAWSPDNRCEFGCGGGVMKRNRMCPLEDCEGDSETETECVDSAECPTEACCSLLEYSNPAFPEHNGQYYMMPDLHNEKAIYTNGNHFIYFTKVRFQLGNLDSRISRKLI